MGVDQIVQLILEHPPRGLAVAFATVAVGLGAYWLKRNDDGKSVSARTKIVLGVSAAGAAVSLFAALLMNPPPAQVAPKPPGGIKGASPLEAAPKSIPPSPAPKYQKPLEKQKPLADVKKVQPTSDVIHPLIAQAVDANALFFPRPKTVVSFETDGLAPYPLMWPSSSLNGGLGYLSYGGIRFYIDGNVVAVGAVTLQLDQGPHQWKLIGYSGIDGHCEGAFDVVGEEPLFFKPVPYVETAVGPGGDIVHVRHYLSKCSLEPQ
jgi:hypothetical protein